MKPSEFLRNNHNQKNFSKFDEDIIKILDLQNSEIYFLRKQVDNLQKYVGAMNVPISR